MVEIDGVRSAADAAERFARSVAGADESAFVEVFQAAFRLADRIAVSGEPDRANRARNVLALLEGEHDTTGFSERFREFEPETAPPDLASDPVYSGNARVLIEQRMERIVGGVTTSEFPDCVAVGGTDHWCCSGTLIAANFVVTAAHCDGRGCNSRVLFGDAVTSGRIVGVEEATRHAGWQSPPGSPNDDIACLRLAEDVTDIAPRKVAAGTDLAGAASVRLVGFGNTDVAGTQGYGEKRVVDVPLASAGAAQGVLEGHEFVAGAAFLDRDSCTGDSGGPAYVQVGDEWLLAGVTSRAIPSATRPCGDGGIYTLMAAYLDWVRTLPGFPPTVA